MLTEPRAVTAANYALEPGGRFYRTRYGRIRAIVMHVTAGLQDLGMEGTDESAEGTNRWALDSGAQVSWHRIADSDGVERCLPSWFTAWHAEGYNSNTVGEEISNVDARWDNKPDDWVTWTLWHAAEGVADWVVEHKIPLRRATKAELDHAIATNGDPVGFIDHSRLSTNRRDPGATFPWDRFFTYVAAVIAGATSPEEDPLMGLTIKLTPTQQENIYGRDEDGNLRGTDTWDADKLLGYLAGQAPLARKYSARAARDAAAALAIAQEQAKQGRALSDEEIDRIAAASAKQTAEELGDDFEVTGDVRLAPKKVEVQP